MSAIPKTVFPFNQNKNIFCKLNSQETGNMFSVAKKILPKSVKNRFNSSTNTKNYKLNFLKIKANIH